MITRKIQRIGGLLVKAWFRPAGEMEKNGKIIQWDKIFQIILVLFEEDRIQKYAVAPEYVEQIQKQLDAVHWGCLIELELNGNKIIDITIVDDALKNFYENN